MTQEGVGVAGLSMAMPNNIATSECHHPLLKMMLLQLSPPLLERIPDDITGGDGGYAARVGAGGGCRCTVPLCSPLHDGMVEVGRGCFYRAGNQRARVVKKKK